MHRSHNDNNMHTSYRDNMHISYHDNIRISHHVTYMSYHDDMHVPHLDNMQISHDHNTYVNLASWQRQHTISHDHLTGILILNRCEEDVGLCLKH